MAWFEAARRGDVVTLQSLVGAHAGSVDESGCTALMLAAQASQLEAVKALITREAGKVSKDGDTALSFAIAANFQAGCKLLAKREATLQVHGRSPLLLAVEAGDLAIVRIIWPYAHVQGVAGPSSRDLLEAAIKTNNLSIVKYVIRKGNLELTDLEAVMTKATGQMKALLQTLSDVLRTSTCPNCKLTNPLCFAALLAVHSGLSELKKSESYKEETPMDPTLTIQKLQAELELKDLRIQQLEAQIQRLQLNSTRTTHQEISMEYPEPSGGDSSHLEDLSTCNHEALRMSGRFTGGFGELTDEQCEEVAITVKGSPSPSANRSPGTGEGFIVSAIYAPQPGNGLPTVESKFCRSSPATLAASKPITPSVDNSVVIHLEAVDGIEIDQQRLGEMQSRTEVSNTSIEYVFLWLRVDQQTGELWGRIAEYALPIILSAVTDSDDELIAERMRRKALKYNLPPLQDAERLTPLMEAAIAGDVQACKDLLEKHGGATLGSGKTALMFAAEENQLACAEVLAPIEAGRVMHQGSQLAPVTALQFAALRNHHEICRLLVDREGGIGDRYGFTALMYAAANSCLESLRVLLPREKRLSTNHKFIVGEGFCALTVAAANDALEAVKLLYPAEHTVPRATARAIAYAEKNSCARFLRR
ncbi:Ankyrin repeat protein 1 [Giardia muris]|uniref:Ankyrin repeat protein 1 n=1 Tax=Giardia muris TaxID=5742 RepID=A0A4Z1SN00_GIAMU|nr:Ankyrin repeat protein 1 [Giardia muris]|eukprot:TNJ27104.1 Ankyrin repeat protein 1 [Giardia muris]